MLGASGRTGRHVVEQGLARGHRITAMVRNPAAIVSRPGLQVVVGNVLDPIHLSAALNGRQAVISCLGQRGAADSNLLRQSARATMLAMAATGVRRLIIVSQGLLFPSKNPLIYLLRVLLRRHVQDSIEMEALVRGSGLDWTIIRPPALKDGRAPTGYRIATEALPPGSWSMQRIDLANILLDEAEHGQHYEMILGAGSARKS